MAENKIYSITGLFHTADDIIHAAEAAQKAGYKKYDVHTSYPIHGMPGAMKMKPSSLSYFALVFGLTGTAFALLLMGYVSTLDYPMIIGGKPYFSLPAFIPITFELTVLLAAIGTVVSMIAVFFKLPNNSHPLHDTDYMKAVSSDKYGISIEASDPAFSEEGVKKFLEDAGADKIEVVYFDNEDPRSVNKAFEPRFIYFLITVFFVTAGTTYFVLNYVLFWQPFNWMSVQNKLNPQHRSTLFADGYGMRMPVEGTVARGYMPYLYKGNQAAAAKYMINPLLPTKSVLAKGKERFDIFCSPCHGYFGKGNSRLRGQFPNPPSLHSEKVTNFQDGDIYHIITEGQNTMPSYAKQITRDERWAIIHYIRTLQRSQNAKETDLK